MLSPLVDRFRVRAPHRLRLALGEFSAGRFPAYGRQLHDSSRFEPTRRRADFVRTTHRVAVVAIGLALVLTGLGCTSTITPPGNPRDPIEVYLVKDYRHVGLVLRRSPDVVVEYGYGDWDWYALMHDRWYHVFDTVLWPTQGTLGRRGIRARDGAELRDRFPCMEVRAIAVASEDARELLADLDAQRALREDEQHYNLVYKLSFVPHDDGFWFLHNCNDAVAGWLRALDCSVSWVPIRLGVALAEE